jgi:AmmeMemoRadiSam system protein B
MKNYKSMNPMKSRIFSIGLLFTLLLIMTGCNNSRQADLHIRPLADTIGFAQYGAQMDAIARQIDAQYSRAIDSMLQSAGMGNEDIWKAVVSPHDDYAYAGFMYEAALRNLKAPVVILFGVAHKARLLNLEDQLIFDSYDGWKGPYGNVPVSGIREEIIMRLPAQFFQVNDSMQRMEHSLEALIPFLQYHDRNIEIVPILVPYMPVEKMNSIAAALAEAIRDIALAKGWSWGKDFAIAISNDAVHYGDEDWGGKNYARYGVDSAGYRAAVEHEWELITAISGELKKGGIERFCNFTVEEQDHREYKWPWCGRYSVPFGLLTAFHLGHLMGSGPLVGSPLGYATSVDHPSLDVEPLGMGVTAPASLRHWVGYAVIGYK